MRNKQEETKDPFAEYDKFWDELDKAEEIKNDEDYFKERSIYKEQSNKKLNRNKKKPSTPVAFFIFLFLTIFIFAGDFRIGNLIFTLWPIIIFGSFVFIVLSILSRLKNL
jgi:lipopolysaccharide export LptBFGC system permease protein LptF